MGRSAVRVGKDTERKIAEYLRQWWPRAERRVVTGWNAGDRTKSDLGDIEGTPGLVWQCKTSLHPNDASILGALRETEDQAVAAGADYGLLIERRRGKADPGHWWCWIRGSDLRSLALGYETHVPEHWQFPVRLKLSHVIPLLLHNGYGQTSDP